MKLKLVSAGSFTMGSREDEQDRFRDELQHRVNISRSFYLGITVVTQGQYQEVLGENPSFFNGIKDIGGVPVDYGFDSNRPVDSVRRVKAIEFCSKLTETEKALGLIKVNQQYRLPTEAEWEYGCRAGTTTRFSYGNSLECQRACDPCSSANGSIWWCGNNGQSGTALWGTHPVKQKNPNPWGFYDMHGNIWEWCQDRYGAYPPEEVTDPKGPAIGDWLLRGGSWREELRHTRSAARWPSMDMEYNEYGFRVVLEE